MNLFSRRRPACHLWHPFRYIRLPYSYMAYAYKRKHIIKCNTIKYMGDLQLQLLFCFCYLKHSVTRNQNGRNNIANNNSKVVNKWRSQYGRRGRQVNIFITRNYLCYLKTKEKKGRKTYANANCSSILILLHYLTRSRNKTKHLLAAHTCKPPHSYTHTHTHTHTNTWVANVLMSDALVNM